MKNKTQLILIFVIFSTLQNLAQKEQYNWYFGDSVGIHFNSIPPSTTHIGTTGTQNGTAVISDNLGNLLFYTNGVTIVNQNHQTMANGTGIFGSISCKQPALILKQPQSNNLYFVFTQGSASNQHYHYSVVDMSLAAGMGSVTIKNVPIWNNSGSSSGVISGTQHCNGTDYWIVCRDYSTNTFHSYLFNASGVSTTPVVSLASYPITTLSSFMKISPNGKKIALVTDATTTLGRITINDFDNSTGAVTSNSVLITGLDKVPIGIEFSPNGKCFYACSSYGGPATTTINTTIRQWNLCAGSEQAVNASMQILSAPVGTINSASTSYGGMQLAPDGKIYITRNSQHRLGQINDPDSLGVACNFVNQGLLIYPKVCNTAFPNFITSPLRTTPMLAPAYTLSCQQVNFDATKSIQAVCAASGYSILSSHWNFGDPLSGATNTTNALSTQHYYNTLGTYTANFIANYQCTSDTIKIVLNIANSAPTFSVIGKTTICAGETATLSANGAYTYSWSTGSVSNSVAVTPTINTTYTILANDPVTGCSTKKTQVLTVSKCAGLFVFDKESLFKIYPNPTDGNFTLETEADFEIAIYNNLGSLVYKTIGKKGTLQINLSHLPKGIYFVELSNDKTKEVVKLVIS